MSLKVNNNFGFEIHLNFENMTFGAAPRAFLEHTIPLVRLVKPSIHFDIMGLFFCNMLKIRGVPSLSPGAKILDSGIMVSGITALASGTYNVEF